jgi:zinc protease
MALAFVEHPYRWPTIGSMAHLEAASIADLETFYRRHYCPSNATVVLAGDLDVEATLALLARGYGSLPSGQPAPRPRPLEPVQKAPRELKFERPIMAPQMVVGYRAACQSDPHFAALEMLSEILVSGDTGRLYQRLVVQEQIATDISGHVYPFAEPGLFEFHMALRPDADPQVALRMLQAELDACAADVCAEELDKARNSLELGVLESLKDVEGRAEALGHFETNELDFGLAFRQTETFAQQDLATLQAACKQTFQPHSRNTVIAMPSQALGGAV